jgi:hypothetical protein
MRHGSGRNDQVERVKCNILWSIGRRMRMIFRKKRGKAPIETKQTYFKFGFVITEQQCFQCPKCKKVLNAGPNYQPKYCAECGEKVSFDGIKYWPEKTLGYDPDKKTPYEEYWNRLTKKKGAL